MEGSNFKVEHTPTENLLTPPKTELSSDLQAKLKRSNELYATMGDPTVRELASLLSHASLVAANDEPFAVDRRKEASNDGEFRMAA